MQQKRIAIFGSTGSIGVQTLDVIASHPDLFTVEILTAGARAEKLIQQARKLLPKIVIIADESQYETVRKALSDTDIQVMAGEQALEDAAASDIYDMMIAAIVGYAGLMPTIKAIETGKTIGLANKETLVVAGDIVMRLSAEKRAPIIPVDSEHSAIFQCLVGEGRNKVEKIILTASGGPFRGKKPNYLMNVRKEHALEHPNWNMGAKISIDSASMMNKGLEMIEAKWLFRLTPEQIDVVVHPQSIIHSLVEFEDGCLKAQMGLPDMRLPIQYALSFPGRIHSDFPRYKFTHPDTLTFEEPDYKTFRNLVLAKEALAKGGNLACVMNAANEIAVYAFLHNKIGFLDMTSLIEDVMNKIPFIEHPTLDDYIDSDGEARAVAASFVKL